MKEKKKLSLAMQIFIALVLAMVAGLLLGNHADFAKTYINPFGTIFLNLLKFIVVPIVLFSIMSGIISMSDIRKVGSIGLKTVLYYLCTTAFAITIGLIGGNLFKGMFPMIATTDLSYEAAETTSFMDTLVNIFPSNFIDPLYSANMLQVIVMAIFFGFAIILVGKEAQPVITGVNSLNTVFMKCMEMILKLSPIGVFCLLCPVIAENGATIIGSLAMVLLTAYICYIVHAVVVYSIAVKTMGGMSPIKFFQGMLPAIMFAFSSASSVGTLPINMECTQKLGASKEVSGRMCNFYCSLLWHSADIPADDYHCPDSNAGIYWHCRCTGRRHGYADHGADFCWSAGRRRRFGRRCGSYLRYGSYHCQYYR